MSGELFSGGLIAGSALLLAPAAAAVATPSVDTPGDNVGRPALDNPAPDVRTAQGYGDRIFNRDTEINTALDTSPLGIAYHKAFGTRGVVGGTAATGFTYNPSGATQEWIAANCNGANGCNGYIKGALNAPPGVVIGDGLPIRECNLRPNPGDGAPVDGTACG